LNTFTTAIQEATWDSIPAIKRKLKGLNFPNEIKILLLKNANLEESGINQEIHMTKLFSTELVNSYPRRLKTKQTSINQFLTDLTADNSTEYSLWKATKYLKRPIAQVPPIKKKTDEKWARSNLEKANIFAQHLK
jgi:hypothetical protein